MFSYWVHTPFWLKKFFPAQMIWDMPAGSEPAVYLTFDDGPHPVATPFVTGQLAQCEGNGSFFCVGNNVQLYPDIYNKLLAEGHTTGNHTFNHLNGWKTDNTTYLGNIQQTALLVDSKLFRPPYGRIKRAQLHYLLHETPPWKIYMWDILSGDFDRTITPQRCADNVLKYIRPGSIIIFHDSEKAWERMRYALPKVIDYCLAKGWKLKALPK